MADAGIGTAVNVADAGIGTDKMKKLPMATLDLTKVQLTQVTTPYNPTVMSEEVEKAKERLEQVNLQLTQISEKSGEKSTVVK